MDYSCVVVAAGSGSRTGLNYNKVFYKLNDKTVIENSLLHFINDFDCKQIIVVINEKEKHLFEHLDLGGKIQYAKGGLTRQDSVYSGLKQVSQAYVMIHDGARPYVSKEVISKVKNALNTYDGAVVMVKSIDTIKIVKNGIIHSTPVRSSLYNAQTPQAFKTSLILEAYDTLYAKNLSVTDDCQAVELTVGSDIFVVEGDYSNIKVTVEKDLV